MAIKYWSRIRNNNKVNALLIKSYHHAFSQDLSWPIAMKSVLSNMGMMESFVNSGNDNNLHVKSFQRMYDIFHQEAFEDFRNENSKLRTYNYMKNKIGMEPYLQKIKSIKDRISFTKFRLSNHSLMIEKGRHQKIDKNRRFCPFCINKIEDEIQLLLECKCFEEHRTNLFHKIRDINFLSLNKIDKFVILMSNINIIPLTAQYITHTMEVRTFLLENHKNNS